MLTNQAKGGWKFAFLRFGPSRTQKKTAEKSIMCFPFNVALGDLSFFKALSFYCVNWDFLEIFECKREIALKENNILKNKPIVWVTFLSSVSDTSWEKYVLS